MRPEQQRLTPIERANLVAFLDGELNEGESRVISVKLDNSPTARREAEALEKTWELLELLERPKASETLADKTLMEVKRLVERGGEIETAFRKSLRRALRAVACVALGFVAFGIGYVLLRWAWPDRTARLVQDLPLAEHLDEYQDVPTFDFLKELANSAEFGTERNP